MNTDLRIARNDATLAHAAAAHELTKLRAKTEKLFDRLSRMNARQGIPVIRAHFGDMLLHEEIVRAKGSRPLAWWIALAPANATGDMMLVHFRTDRRGWVFDPLPVRLSAHAVARFLQRTVGRADLSPIRSLLWAHYVAASEQIDAVSPDHELITAGRDGALIWVRVGDELCAVTWLAVDTMADAEIANVCRSLTDGTVGTTVRRTRHRAAA